MASSILLVVVVAVMGSVTAGQQHAYEAHQQIAASLAAEELMNRLIHVDYDDLNDWNGFCENAGALVDADGVLMPDSMQVVKRSVFITNEFHALNALDINIQGKQIKVIAATSQGRVLTELLHFIPEPAEDTVN